MPPRQLAPRDGSSGMTRMPTSSVGQGRHEQAGRVAEGHEQPRVGHELKEEGHVLPEALLTPEYLLVRSKK